jgi:hypothetical protein
MMVRNEKNTSTEQNHHTDTVHATKDSSEEKLVHTITHLKQCASLSRARARSGFASQAADPGLP